MRFGRTSSLTAAGSSIDLTAMIDVVFLLIVFFMVAATVAHRWPEDMLLPEETGQRVVSDIHDLVLHVDAEGVIRRGQLPERIPVGLLGSVVGDSPSDRRVLVRADRRCLSMQLDPVLDALRSLGVRQLDLGVVTDR